MAVLHFAHIYDKRMRL